MWNNCSTGILFFYTGVAWFEKCLRYFPSAIPPLFDSVKGAIKSWIDDFTGHAKSEQELLNYLEALVAMCTHHDLRLSGKHSSLYTKKARWCGRIVDSDGYTLDPQNMDTIRDMTAPSTAAELY